MTTALRRGGVALATAILLMSAVTGPAWSEAYSHRDARHDVAGSAAEANDYHRAANNRTIDVTRLQVIHSSTRIRFNVTLRSGSMKSLVWRSVTFKLKTNTDTLYGTWTQFRLDYTFQMWNDATGADIPCGSLRKGRVGRTIWLSFNRSCADNPRWIRAGVSVAGHSQHRDYYDLAQADSWAAQDFKHLTPRLHPTD